MMLLCNFLFLFCCFQLSIFMAFIIAISLWLAIFECLYMVYSSGIQDVDVCILSTGTFQKCFWLLLLHSDFLPVSLGLQWILCCFSWIDLELLLNILAFPFWTSFQRSYIVGYFWFSLQNYYLHAENMVRFLCCFIRVPLVVSRYCFPMSLSVYPTTSEVLRKLLCLRYYPVAMQAANSFGRPCFWKVFSDMYGWAESLCSGDQLALPVGFVMSWISASCTTNLW